MLLTVISPLSDFPVVCHNCCRYWCCRSTTYQLTLFNSYKVKPLTWYSQIILSLISFENVLCAAALCN